MLLKFQLISLKFIMINFHNIKYYSNYFKFINEIKYVILWIRKQNSVWVKLELP